MYLCLMFYRRKVILAIIQAFGGELEKIRLQKLLFLFAKRQSKAEYDFIPYKFGCYSYSANADLTAMASKGQITETQTHFRSNERIDYNALLKEADRKALAQVRLLYGNMNSNDLMRHTYVQYPFYAINSVKAASILTPQELENVQNAKPACNRTTLFTIGYEGISLESYLNKLLLNDIKVLIDVRRNPLSMKYGFSKGQLTRYCENLGILYVHLPEVGIASDQRQELNTQGDYDRLFDKYKETLPSTKPTQDIIISLLHKHHRVALTCFEANICQCHRKHLAEALIKHPDFMFDLNHI